MPVPGPGPRPIGLRESSRPQHPQATCFGCGRSRDCQYRMVTPQRDRTVGGEHACGPPLLARSRCAQKSGRSPWHPQPTQLSVRGCICCSGASPCTEAIPGRKGRSVGCGALPPSHEEGQRSPSGLSPTPHAAETGVAPEEAGLDRGLLSSAAPTRLFLLPPVRLTAAVGINAGLRRAESSHCRV